jgi:HPt (histidine-containing phosphotransfer) domain-containing protein
MYAMTSHAAAHGPGQGFLGGNSDEPTIDLVHLARQTDGDTALEAELLTLFDRQAANLLAQLVAECPARESGADIAHKLRGSALAIGAGRVATAAQILETLFNGESVTASERKCALAGLTAAVAEARGAIAELLG